MIRRLHHRIYLSLLVVALLSVAGAGFVSHVLPDRRFESPYAARLLAEAEFLARALPEGDALPAELQRLADGLRLHAVVMDADGAVIASTVAPAPVPPRRPLRPGQPPKWTATRHGAALMVAMSNGRALAVWSRHRHRGGFVVIGAFFVLAALVSLPVARGLTRRLSAVERGFSELGAGRLSARVTVEGRDEIARLAERFNASAERIEGLVAAQRRALQTASHELRSPLARIRMALELIRDAGGPEVAPRVADAIRDIGELDALVDDLLLASRIEAGQPVAAAEPVDVAAIVAEEAGRIGARLEIAPASIRGDPRLLRRLVRNLVDNAVRHGGGEIAAGVLSTEAGGARLWIADRGPGVPSEDRERIFAPFHRGSRVAADTPGVGLGLSLVRQIAERHGGTVVYRDREGGGAVFEVVLSPAPRA